MEHLWSLSNMTRVHVDSGLPYSETAELYLLKDTLVKRKFLSLSEVLCFHLLYEV
jgi:hypothetical protein